MACAILPGVALPRSAQRQPCDARAVTWSVRWHGSPADALHKTWEEQPAAPNSYLASQEQAVALAEAPLSPGITQCPPVLSAHASAAHPRSIAAP